MIIDWVWLVPPFLVAYAFSLGFPRWEGYKKAELARYGYTARVDPLGFLFMFMLVRSLVSLCATSAAGEDSSFTIEDYAVETEANAPQRVVPAAIVWFFGLFPLFTHLNAIPLSEESMDAKSWQAGSWAGLWIFLTRWAIVSHAMYLSMSLYAEMHGGHFRVEMYSAATNMAPLCSFVSIQYYTLVHYHSHTEKIRKIWNSRGCPFDFLNAVTHVPPIILAYVDLFLVKDRSLVVATRPSPAVMAGVSLTFVSSYVGATVVNKGLTGQWPYRMMDDRIKDIWGFAWFFISQTCIFYVFLAGAVIAEYFFLW